MVSCLQTVWVLQTHLDGQAHEVTIRALAAHLDRYRRCAMHADTGTDSEGTPPGSPLIVEVPELSGTAGGPIITPLICSHSTGLSGIPGAINPPEYEECSFRQGPS